MNLLSRILEEHKEGRLWQKTRDVHLSLCFPNSKERLQTNACQFTASPGVCSWNRLLYRWFVCYRWGEAALVSSISFLHWLSWLVDVLWTWYHGILTRHSPSGPDAWASWVGLRAAHRGNIPGMCGSKQREGDLHIKMGCQDLHGWT